MRLMLSVTIAVCLLPIAVISATDYHLDLTEIAKPPDPQDPPPARGVSVGPVHAGALPLRVTITALDKAAYMFGDSFVFEVELSNLGTTPIDLPCVPWGIDHDLLVQSASVAHPLKTALLSIGTFDQTHSYPMAVASLEGTAGFPNTVKTLAPGDTATVRVPGTIYLGEDALRVFRATGGPSTLLRAELVLEVRPSAWTDRIVSSGVPVVLQ